MAREFEGVENPHGDRDGNAEADADEESAEERLPEVLERDASIHPGRHLARELGEREHAQLEVDEEHQACHAQRDEDDPELDVKSNELPSSSVHETVPG